MEDVQEPASGESKQAPEGGEGGEDEEDESEEKKEKTPRKPRAKKEAAATPAAAPASAGTSSRGRERKSVVAYVPQSPKFSQSDELLPVEAGPGTPLGEIENVKHRLDITHATDAEVKALFHAAYPNSKTGHTKKVVKANIRAFSGYPKAQADQLAEAAVVRLEKNSTEILRLVAQMCDLGHSAPRAKLIEHIVDFLRKPKSSGHAFQGGAPGKKRKSASSTKKTSKKGAAADGEKKKRPITPFFVFMVSVAERAHRLAGRCGVPS